MLFLFLWWWAVRVVRVGVVSSTKASPYTRHSGQGWTGSLGWVRRSRILVVVVVLLDRPSGSCGHQVSQFLLTLNHINKSQLDWMLLETTLVVVVDDNRLLLVGLW